MSTEDWKELHGLFTLLQQFKTLTVELQGNIQGERMNGAIFNYLPAMDILLQGLEQVKKMYTSTKSPFASCINLAWKKLDEYYKLSDKSPVYRIAVILDPRLKLQYFERKWRTHQDWIKLAREKFCEMYREYCDRLTTTPTFERGIPIVQSPHITALMSWKFEANGPSNNTDEMEEYLESKVENGSVSPCD